jgi:hypothetical protein
MSVKFFLILNTLHTRSGLCIPKNETARPRSQFPHSCICERFVYSHDLSTYLAAVRYAMMHVEIWNEAMQFHFWKDLFGIFGTMSLQCM